MSTTGELERDIEQTRRQLAQTLDELRACLAPKQIAAQLLEKARASSPKQRIAISLAVLGAGALWAFVARQRKPQERSGEFASSTPIPHFVMAAVLTFLAGGLGGRPSLATQQQTASASNEPSFEPDHARDAVAEGVNDRGRLAAGPLDIPARGWKDILLRVYNNVSAHRVFAIAAGVTFYTLLAIFPAIAALVSLYGLFADAGTIATHLDDLSGLLPEGAIEVVRQQMTRLVSQGQGTLGLTFAISLLTSIWSANAGMKAFFDALNIIYGENEKRGLIKLNALSLLFTAGALVFLLVALGAIVVLPAVLNYVGFTDSFNPYLPLLRWPGMFVVITLALAVLYRYGPSRDEAKWHWITWGSAVAALVWISASILFSWYTAHFGNYNATYGSLGAVIGFMIWIWLSTIVFLMGAELDGEMEHQTLRDTTTGTPRPLGARGARMADTVGAAQAQ